MKKKTLAALLAAVKKQHANLLRKKTTTEREKKRLEKLGVRHNARPLWKIQKINKAGETSRYLRISYGRSRPYEYIGKDPAKIKAAIASIERAKWVNLLENDLLDLDADLSNLIGGLQTLLEEQTHTFRSKH